MKPTFMDVKDNWQGTTQPPYKDIQDVTILTFAGPWVGTKPSKVPVAPDW